MLKKILPFIGKYKKETILAPITMIGEVLMEVLIPLVMAKIVDIGVNGDGGSAYIIKMGLLMIVMAVFSLMCGMLSAKYASTASMGFGSNLRLGLFKKISDFSFSNTDKFSTSSLITRLTTDIMHVQMAYQMIIRMCIRSPFMFIMASVMAVSLNAKLSLVLLIAVPLVVVAMLFFVKKSFPLFQKMFKKYDKMNSVVQENLTGMRVVKAFVREDLETEKFDNAAGEVYKTSVAAEKVMVLTGPLMQFAMFACMLAVAWFGSKFIILETMLTGELISYLSYVQQVLSSLMMVGMIIIMIVMARASLGRICEVLDEKIDITDEDAKKDAKVENGSIEFENVNFSYSKNADNLTLTDINLSIKSGEKIGIIGATGSAKSSLVQLIPRLYDALSGSVKVGGRDVKEYSLKELRDNVAMVLQKNVLFSGTIAENLRWGNEEATDEQLIEACKNAQAHEFIMSFPEGYNTKIERGGTNVSGGQKQRLCIARALLKNPKILILDDSTSAVDTATDAKIQSAFRTSLGDITTIIIAQRINSVQDADRIVVLEDGMINAVGTHKELLETNEIYKDVYLSQQKGGEE